MMRTMLMCAFLCLNLSGCAFVDRHASGMAEQLKPNQCATETTQAAPDYSVTSSYRCVGEGCHRVGCGK